MNMDELYLLYSAVLISIVIFLLSHFGKLYNLLSYVLKKDDSVLQVLQGVRSFDEIPCPKGLPYLGDVFNFALTSDFKEQMTALQNAFKKYGPIFKRTIMGKTTVFFENPTDVEAVFKGDGRHPMRPDEIFRPQQEHMNSRELPEGLASLTNGEKWSRLRKALAPKMLRPKNIHDNLENFNSVTRDAIDHMVAIRGADRTIPDLEGELAKYATESVGTMAFDERVGLYDDPPNEEIVKMIKATFDGFKYMGKLNWGWEALLYRFVNTPSYRKFCESQDTLFAISQKIVDKKILELNKMAEDGEEFVKNQAVPMLTYLITKGELTPKEINVNCILMFRAGVETTSTGLLWLLYDLARNPGVQEKVYEEVTSLVGPHGDFTPDSFAKLDYLKACVKESMRLHPAAPWERRLTQDVVLSGYQVPSGTAVLYSNYLSGRSEKLFKFPLEFKPERWLNEDLGKIHPFASLPFGVGTRMCIGRRIAETEICLLTAKLVQRFILEYHEEPADEKLRFLVIPDRPLRLKFIDRE
ncbi:hypothetical protein ACROYT_G029100 [Oculina patagonica]